MSRNHRIRKREKGEHLRYACRQRLESLVRDNHTLPRKRRKTQRELAEYLDTSPATISRELRRGRVKLLRSDLTTFISYSADVAEASYVTNATAKGPQLKIGKDWDFVEHVELMIINHHYSPDAIIMELRREGNPFRTDICTSTLYSYIDQGVFPRVCIRHLRRQGKQAKRKYRSVRLAHTNRDGKSITDRPPEVEDRAVPGHYEMDAIESGKKHGRACLLTLIDRTARKAYMEKMSSQTQGEVIKALDRIERRMGARLFRRTFKSITVDNGSEFLDWRGMEKSVMGKEKRTSIYYAHPYRASERGSNENFNGMVRWFVPKGSDISKLCRSSVRNIESWMNNYPRRTLGGASANLASARAEAR